MALSGLHVACGYAGRPNSGASPNALLRQPIWAETMASAGTTVKAATGADGQPFDGPIFSIISSADAWVAMGPTPDPSQATSSRRLVRANQEYDFFVNVGDKLAWIAA